MVLPNSLCKFFVLKEGYVYWLSDKHIMRSFCDSPRVRKLNFNSFKSILQKLTGMYQLLKFVPLILIVHIQHVYSESVNEHVHYFTKLRDCTIMAIKTCKLCYQILCVRFIIIHWNSFLCEIEVTAVVSCNQHVNKKMWGKILAERDCFSMQEVENTCLLRGKQ